ncbi:helix-turn-helix transcriptional regulator [Streptomyces sp. NPDC020412]|uniref:helix-turn-helix transcriptional regulator n=1 Tax=Streptomyces sp. NPDC020412 TaxID=3365073 RepID=UPI0037A37D51
MEEYASARLLELVQRALAAEGIHAVAPAGDGALLPLAAKRVFLLDVARDHGLLPLLRVGAMLPVASSDPAVAALLSAVDPARRWTLGCLAAELGMPARSLQRRLAAAGGFSGLLGTVRAQAAAELLMAGEHPVSVIGFVCGYADQPHFTRHFKARTAMTPAVYRSVFQRPSPGGREGHPHEPTKRRSP